VRNAEGGGMPKRILVVDDHEVVRQGVQRILHTHPEWEIVAEAKDGVEAIEKAKLFDPDLVILDISMPHKDGLEVAAELTTTTRCKVLVLTMHDPDEVIAQVRNAGASGYLIKTQAGKDLVRAVQEILDGGMFFPAGDPPSLNVIAEKPTKQKKSGMFRSKGSGGA
jgi:DNA-binding NarL/FixJ family response regulator